MSLAEACQIGTSQAELTPLESIDTGIPQPIPQPWMHYYPERKRVKLTGGKTVGIGAPYIVWHWDFLKAEWRHALREYLTGISTVLYIESQINEDEDADGADDWAQFQVTAVWPEGDEGKDAGLRLGFDIEFDVIQEVEPLA